MPYPADIVDFKKRFPNYENLTVSSLKRSAPSKWTRRHLIAYRVLLIPAGETLPPLAAFDQQARADFEGSDISKQLSLLKWNEITKLNPVDLAEQASKLWTFYNALAEVLTSFPPPPRKYPTRDRVVRVVPNYQSGAGYNLSSSPDEDTSSTQSEWEIPEDEPADCESDVDSAKGEDVVVNLVHLFLISVAYLALAPRDHHENVTNDFGTLGFSVRRQTYDVDSFKHNFKAINDGTMVLYRNVAGERRLLWDYRLNCSVEAKEKFTQAEKVDDSDANGTVSDNTFAQCFAQMLGMVQAQLKSSRDAAHLRSHKLTAFVILAHHDSVHVLSAEFTTAYLVYLRGGPESWIHVRYTRSFKLRNINDRLAAAVVVLALLYYVKETFGADDEAEEDSEDAEEGADDEAEEDSGDAEEGEGDEELGDNGDEVDDVEGEEDAKEEDDKDWPEEEEEESDRDNGDIDEEQRHVLESDVDARKRKRRRLEA